MSYDPTFAQRVAQAQLRDPVLLQKLDMAGSDDTLGRVRDVGGRLDFAHVSNAGLDAGAQPPLESIEADLRRIDLRGSDLPAMTV